MVQSVAVAFYTGFLARDTRRGVRADLLRDVMYLIMSSIMSS